MVNYCCVQNCGRNSKLSSHLTFFCLPKERHRQRLWMVAGGRGDLLEKLNSKSSYRFCSRHFTPSSIKNKTLSHDALPTLCLPGSEREKSPEMPVQHHDIVCNSCNSEIFGFRYKCVTCVDYDLCPKCETMETHSHHYMIRIPRPLKFKVADDMIQKWKEFFKSHHVKPDCTQSSDEGDDSSDDEPITKYVKQYDSGVDLSEDVKVTLRKEVERVLTLKEEVKGENEKSKSNKSSRELRTRSTAVKRSGIETGSSSKKQKVTLPLIESVKSLSEPSPAPALAFADVNELPERPEVKYPAAPVPSIDGVMEGGYTQPLMHVKLSDDLTELMIEMTQNGEKTVYKYID